MLSNWKSFIASILGKFVQYQVRQMAGNALQDQVKIFHQLIYTAKNTKFGLDHHFAEIDTIQDFQKLVPIRDYEDFKNYIQEIKEGKANIIWPGKPLYFAKTSGTTSGVKYIPISKESMPYHFSSARNAVFNYASLNKDFSYLDGKLIFLSGSPETSEVGGIPTGRLSGLVNLHIPSLFKRSQLPDFKTNCIEDWDTKVEKIMDECIGQDLRLISGIPPWVQMFAEKILERTGKQNIREVFPNLKMLVSGGVNFAPYKPHYERLFGENMPRVDTYPASEGFIGFQYSPNSPFLILNTNAGIFFEFVTIDELNHENPSRLSLAEVKTGETYAILLSTNAGIWCYNIGDTIEFVSLAPYLFEINGRVSQYISAFGEHVIEKEIELALLDTCSKHNATVTEYTVAPEVSPAGHGKPYHEWFVEFSKAPTNLNSFSVDLDEAMTGQNIYYKDLIVGKILVPLKLNSMKPDAFRNYMRDIGKLGGQNKVPHLRNDRKLADGLVKYKY